MSLGGGKSGYALKADIRHYFDNVDHEILLRIIERKIRDPGVVWLVKIILKNHRLGIAGKGMPIGNLTSQFFANVYLNELDKFVKHNLKVKYYIRYVDDFVIFHKKSTQLEIWRALINQFLLENLKIELHPEKSRVVPLQSSITLLGFRVFYHYRLLKKSNTKRIWKRLDTFELRYSKGQVAKEKFLLSLNGWYAYAEFANTYKLRKRVAARFSEIVNE